MPLSAASLLSVASGGSSLTTSHVAEHELLLLLSQYRARHEKVMGEASSGRSTEVLICQLFAGLGHIINVVIGCLALALVTWRALVLDHTHPAYHYPYRLDAIFEDAPFRMIVNDEMERRFSADPSLTELDPRDVACLELRGPRYAGVALRWRGSYSALPLLLMNPAHEGFFRERFGTDDFGVPPVTQLLGPVLFTPARRLLSQIDDLRSMHRTAFSIGIHSRLGFDPVAEFWDRPDERTSVHASLRCGFAHTPAAFRRGARTWIVVADRSDSKVLLLHALASSRGGLQSISGNASSLRNVSHVLAGSRVSGPSRTPSSVRDLNLIAAEFGSGDVMLFLDYEVTNLRTTELRQMEAAVLEMWWLGTADTLVITENSMFSVAAYAFHRRSYPTFVVPRGPNPRCYPLQSSEPATSLAIEAMQESLCWSEELLSPQTLWAPSPPSYTEHYARPAVTILKPGRQEAPPAPGAFELHVLIRNGRQGWALWVEQARKPVVQAQLRHRVDRVVIELLLGTHEGDWQISVCLKDDRGVMRSEMAYVWSRPDVLSPNRL